MDDIDHDKALAALEAEKERRLQVKIDSGELVSVQTTVVVGARDEDTDDACARALANLPTTTPDGREIHHDLIVIVTGVPRDPNFGQWERSPQIQIASSERAAHPSEEPAGSGEVLSPSSPSEPAYVQVTVRNGNADGDPGQIAAGLWSVDEEGCVVLTNLEGKHITSRMLLKGTDPATLARVLLREVEGPKAFNDPIHYPKLGLA
jgi:hypothetical protein